MSWTDPRDFQNPGTDSGNPFTPDAFQDVQGPSYTQGDAGTELEEAVEETEQETGLDFDVFDGMEVDDSLPENVPAATREDGYRLPFVGNLYSDTVLVANPNLFEMSDSIRNHALIHEWVHGNYFQDQGDRPLEEADIPRQDAGELYNMMKYGNEAEMEGATEFIAHALDPNSSEVGRTFYPDEMSAVENRLDSDSEIMDDINSLRDDIIDEYRDVYDVEVGDRFYREKGEFAGMEYDAVIFGDEASIEGEDAVRDYLETVSNYMKDGEYGFPEVDEGYKGESSYDATPAGMAPNNSINWDGWDEKFT